MKRIKPLGTELINQIAAGEVIERPASVVKELLENSLDAGASELEITIRRGGYDLIQIRDNGVGVVKEDLPLAIQSHATSKINTFAHLSALQSLGFRGEALASISSVSRFTLQSRTADQAEAWQLQVNGQQEPASMAPVAHPQGTTIQVRDLFFNTPVRKKFLRSEKTEFDHIETIVKRIALSHDHCRWQLQHNDKQVLYLPAATDVAGSRKRAMRIFGKTFMDNAVWVEKQAAGMTLTGWLGLPSFMRSQNDLQYFYLNQRVVRDKLIQHAIRQAYEDVLHPGRQPAYLLYLTLDPEAVDVNVHPTKYEVRFHEGRMVHDFIFSTLSKSLMSENDYVINTESVNRSVHEAKAQMSEAASVAGGNKPQADYPSVTDEGKSKVGYASVAGEGKSQVNYATHAAGEDNSQVSGTNTATERQSRAYTAEDNSQINTFSTVREVRPLVGSAVNQSSGDEPAALGKGLCQIGNRYLLVKADTGVLICDICRAQQQLDYHDFVQQFSQGAIVKRSLLVPTAMKMTDLEWKTWQQQRENLERLGWSFAPVDEKVVSIQEFPLCLTQADLLATVHELLGYLASQTEDQSLPWEQLFTMMACQNAQPQCLSLEQIQSLLRKLAEFAKGRDTLEKLGIIRQLDSQHLEKLFNRRI